MPLPPTLAYLTACASLLTAIKSGWELSRMIKKQLKERVIQEQANQLFASVCEAYDEKKICLRDYHYWKRRISVAAEEKDCMVFPLIEYRPQINCASIVPALLRIRSYLRQIYGSGLI